MKKLLFILTILLYSCASNPIKVEQREKVKQYSLNLQEQGYCKDWADHLALVELGIIKPDRKYKAILND